MADGKTEEGCEKELTAKQRKNRKKKEAAKRKKQEQNLTESGKVPEKTREKDEEKSQESSETTEDKFHRELNWCIGQLEMGLAFQKPDKKQAEVVHRHLRSLKSSKTPLPRKRQLMFSLFGDYRKKMQEDQRKQRQEPAVNPKLAVVKQEEQKSIFVKVCQTKATDMNSQKDADNQDESGENNWKFQKSDNNFRFEFGDNSESASS